VSSFLGHGGAVECISVSPGDPHGFVTAGSDGIVRLYDARAHAPAFAAHGRDEFIPAVAYVHQSGIPCERCLEAMICMQASFYDKRQIFSPAEREAKT
jgi:WD40 repeat protein